MKKAPAMQEGFALYLPRNEPDGIISMSSGRTVRATFDITNSVRRRTFRFPDISHLREPSRPSSRMKQTVLIGAVLLGRLRAVWQRPWPLTARVPIVSGALILTVSIAISHVMISTIGDEQELGVRRLAAVNLDGISTTIYPHVFARNLTNTTEALRRTRFCHPSRQGLLAG
jgi:hypothetical protein